jgi:ATP-GRASP peptide maturase of grasp-with-spasm system
MILILSYEGDWSTDNVISWLKQFDYPCLRLNSYDFFTKDFFLDFQNKILYVGDQVIDFNKINVVWFRKFGLFRSSNHFKSVRELLDSESANAIANEFWAIAQAIVDLLQHKKWLTHYNNSFLNKINVLAMAEAIGLDVPKTYIVNTNSKIKEIISEGSVISKSVDNVTNVLTKKGSYTMFTSRIKDEEVDNFPKRFFPSLMQAEIKKKYEIRSFFLIDKFYSMAIFSQGNARTEVDFRKYNMANPNRDVPYQLPEEVEEKLRQLLANADLNCASIDLMKSIDNKYYFLEINPVGQFGMVDFTCNYGLHKKVAQTLIAMDKEPIVWKN